MSTSRIQKFAEWIYGVKSKVFDSQRIAHDVEPGDIVAFEGVSSSGLFIRLFTWSRYSHVAIVSAEKEQGTYCIYEYPAADSTIVKTRLSDKLTSSDIVSVKLLKRPENVAGLGINPDSFLGLMDNFSDRLKKNSGYNLKRAGISGINRIVISIITILVITNGLFACGRFFYCTFSMSCSPIGDGWISFAVFLSTLFLFIVVCFSQSKAGERRRQKIKLALIDDFCSEYVASADKILGGKIHTHRTFESDFRPKDIVRAAESLGYKSTIYKKE